MPIQSPTNVDLMQWDVVNWSVALPFWDSQVDWPNTHRALELGGREGGLSLWLAHRGVAVVCSDVENAAATAGPCHRSFGVESRVTYEDVDATAIPYENEFDVIVFKSIIGGIGRGGNRQAQQAVFDASYKALRPGGILLFAENVAASPVHRFFRRRFVSWGDYWRYATVLEMSDFLKMYTSVELKTTGVLGAFGRTEGQRRLLGHLDQALVNHLVPNDWRYVAYGSARKGDGSY